MSPATRPGGKPDVHPPIEQKDYAIIPLPDGYNRHIGEAFGDGARIRRHARVAAQMWKGRLRIHFREYYQYPDDGDTTWRPGRGYALPVAVKVDGKVIHILDELLSGITLAKQDWDAGLIDDEISRKILNEQPEPAQPPVREAPGTEPEDGGTIAYPARTQPARQGRGRAGRDAVVRTG